jgi:hypothetical protein
MSTMANDRRSMRLVRAVLAVGWAAVGWCGSAHADSRWFDPKMGCGPVGAYAHSGRAADLPGCTGRLPKDAPQVEAAMHDLKQKLVDAEELLAKDKLDKVEPLLAEVETSLSRTLPAHPEMPDRWEQAQRIYAEAVAQLRARRKLAPHLDRLRTTWTAAMESDRVRNKKEIEGGPHETLQAAVACNTAFAEVRGLGVDQIPIELEKKAPPRRLDQAAADCERVRRSAMAVIAEQEKAYKARRAQWRSVLKGARRKVFDEHKGQLPEFDGAPADWRAIATVASWRYTSPTGVETYTWKGNKLLNRTAARK